MASDTVTPDGYQVNADGAWVENGVVMARTLEENTIGGEAMLPITIQVGDQEFEAELYDNETARELISRFLMTIAMEELNGNEKYYYLPESLPTDTREIGIIHEGDLMLFGSDCLVLFYKDFQTSYRYRMPKESVTGRVIYSYLEVSTVLKTSPKSMRPLSRLSSTSVVSPLEMW